MVWYHLPVLDPPANISRSFTFPLEMKQSCLSPPWLARLHPCHLKDTLTKTHIEFNKAWAGFSASIPSFPPLSHPSNPIISFSAAVIRAHETSPRSGRKLVAEGRSWIPTLSLHPQPCPARQPSQQERSSQATATRTSTSRHRKCSCRPSSGAF